VHALAAVGITAGVPALGSPALSTSGGMAAVGVTTGAPTLGSPALSQVHALAALGIAAGVPQLGAPQLDPPAQPEEPQGAFLVLRQRRTHALTALPLITGRPILGRPMLSVRSSPAQIALLADADARAAQRAAALADDEDAIIALLLAA
jgi:hypothetical protein